MEIDLKTLGKDLGAALSTVAGKHWKAVKQLSKEDLEFIKATTIALAADVTAGRVTEEQAKMEAQDLRDAIEGMRDVLEIEGKVLAQDLVNTAIGVVSGALTKAIGIAL
jgi:Mn-dependent DtxR family transcriptional regulator